MCENFFKQCEDYIFMENAPETADIIFVPGNSYPQMAEHAALLYRQGYAPLILPSGCHSINSEGFGSVTSHKDKYNEDYRTECEFLCDVLKKNGVPCESILKEDRATYTWENAKFSAQAVHRAGLAIHKAILCCKNYHSRRAFLYYSLAFPDTEILVCPSCVDGITRDNWRQTEEGIDAVTGEMTRIIRQFSLLM